MSKIRRLAALDGAAHGSVPAQTVGSAETTVVAAAPGAFDDASDPSVFLDMGSPLPDSAVVAPDASADREEHPPEQQVTITGDAFEPPAAEGAGEQGANAQAAEPLVVAQRAELLDTLASLGPIFRAAAIFPGPDAPQERTLQVIQLLSRDAVMLANMVASETDPLEIDQRWRRRRAGTLTSELVANHWISTIISQGGMCSVDAWPLQWRPKLAAAISTVIDQISSAPITDVATSSASAAIFALAPLVLDLQRFADVIHASVPSFMVDADTAAALVGAVVGEEVQAATLRLEPLLPGLTRLEIGCELMAQVGPMALAAWEGARGEVLDRLKDVVTPEEAHELLSDPSLCNGVPVDRVIERLRPMVRRLVGATVYSAKMVGGSQ
ncbi:MAG: hypothetical protein VB135_00155 [Burkholderia sp.]